MIKLTNRVGITSKATDWAPELGVMFGFQSPTKPITRPTITVIPDPVAL
jgi:hypothetical protein